MVADAGSPVAGTEPSFVERLDGLVRWSHEQVERGGTDAKTRLSAQRPRGHLAAAREIFWPARHSRPLGTFHENTVTSFDDEM